MRNYSRDPDYGKPPRWDRLYARHFPQHTDPYSRHVCLIADACLRTIRSPVRRLLIDAGYEPDHWASSMEVTVKLLWQTKAEIQRLREKYEPEKLARDKARSEAKIRKLLDARK